MAETSTIVALISGGAAGAVITFLAAMVRGRIQPISYDIRARVILLPETPPASGDADLASLSGQKIYEVDLIVRNKGNADIEQFSFSTAFSESVNILSLECLSKDPHHGIVVASRNSNNREFEVKCGPFNRRDEYLIRMIATLSQHRMRLFHIVRFSSPSGITFVETRRSRARASHAIYDVELPPNLDASLNIAWRGEDPMPPPRWRVPGR